jgi:hypothetical protein
MFHSFVQRRAVAPVTAYCSAQPHAPNSGSAPTLQRPCPRGRWLNVNRSRCVGWGAAQIEPAQTETAGGGRGGRAPPPLPPGGVAAGCWFCLSNPEADPSLVASICTDFYMCIDKVGKADPYSTGSREAVCGSNGLSILNNATALMNHKASPPAGSPSGFNRACPIEPSIETISRVDASQRCGGGPHGHRWCAFDLLILVPRRAMRQLL